MEPLTQFDPDTYDGVDDFAKSLDVAYEHIRRRMADGGPGWVPKLSDDHALTLTGAYNARSLDRR